jgi:sugar-specific transcriptional regulator TrmB
MATIDKTEYKFPDEVDGKEAEDSLEIEIEDDTPPEDRGRQPMPQDVVQELEADELDEYSDKAKERLKQLKKVWNDERREKERVSRENQEAIAMAQRVLEENKRLKATLKTGEEEYLSTMRYAADRDLEMAKEKYKQALESYDNDQVIDAQQELTEATLRADKAKNFRPTLQDVENEVQLPQTQARSQNTAPDPKYANWVSRNETWFQKDPEMTQAAFGLHEKLAQQYGTQYIGTDDYYKRIDTTIRKRFPEAFQNTPDEDDDSADSKPQRKTSTVVASAKRSTAPRQIKLTATQAALAKKFKLTPEQYAREVLKLENK